MGSPSFEYRFRSIEEGIAEWGSEVGAEWGSEVGTEWDCEAQEREDSPCSDM